MDDKSKKEIIVFVILIFVFVNFGINELVLKQKLNEAKAMEETYQYKKATVSTMRVSIKDIDKIRKEVEEDKLEAQKLNELVSDTMETPKFIYEFYNACKKYKINGELISFDPIENFDNESENDNIDIDLDDNEANDNTDDKESTDEGEVSNDEDSKEYVESVDKLKKSVVKSKIRLKINGDKSKVDEFINNLNKIITKKINLVSIKLYITQEIVYYEPIVVYKPLEREEPSEVEIKENLQNELEKISNDDYELNESIEAIKQIIIDKELSTNNNMPQYIRNVIGNRKKTIPAKVNAELVFNQYIMVK